MQVQVQYSAENMYNKFSRRNSAGLTQTKAN
jgi:hypothetical protein